MRFCTVKNLTRTTRVLLARTSLYFSIDNSIQSDRLNSRFYWLAVRPFRGLARNIWFLRSWFNRFWKRSALLLSTEVDMYGSSMDEDFARTKQLDSLTSACRPFADVFRVYLSPSSKENLSEMSSLSRTSFKWYCYRSARYLPLQKLVQMNEQVWIRYSHDHIITLPEQYIRHHIIGDKIRV